MRATGSAGALGLRGIAGAALVALAAIMALSKGFEQLKKSASESFETGVNAAAAGLPVGRLSAISQALATHGLVPEEETQGFLARLNQAQLLARHGNSGELQKLAPALAQLGVQGDITNMPADALFQEIAKGMAKLRSDDAIAIGQMLGMSEKLSLALHDAGANLDKFAQEATGTAVRPEDVAAAKAFNEEMAKLDQQWVALRRELLTDFEPALTKIIDGFIYLAKVLRTVLATVTGHFGDIPKIWSGGETTDMETGLANVREHESGSRAGNYQAQNPRTSASGAYQIIDETWREAARATGQGLQYQHAKEAPPEIQDINAHWLAQTYGFNSPHTWKASGPDIGKPYPELAGPGDASPTMGDGVSKVAQKIEQINQNPRPIHDLAESARQAISNKVGEVGKDISSASWPSWWSFLQGDSSTAEMNPQAGSTPPPAPPSAAQHTSMINQLQAGPHVASNTSTANDNSRSVTVGDIYVSSNASSPKAVASEVHDQLQRNLYAAQLNNGLV